MAQSAVPNLQLGPYRVLGQLGEGASGIVYRVAGPNGSELALKVLRPELSLSERERSRFLDEASRLHRVRHPALVEVVEAGVLPTGLPYIAMPFYRGESLADRLRRGPVRFDVALHLFEQLADGLNALHREGLVHRDIKPENIFVTEGDARALLLDLGIARDVNASPSTTTHAGLIRGTPAYMAPERFFGAPASPATDIYELGVVLYVTLVGALPWTRFDDPTERMRPAAPSARGVVLPPRLQSTIMRALATSPGERPQSASEFASAVLDALSPQSAAQISGQATAFVQAIPGGLAAPPVSSGVVVAQPQASFGPQSFAHPSAAAAASYAPTMLAPSTAGGGPTPMAAYGPAPSSTHAPGAPLSASPAVPVQPREKKKMAAALVGALTGATLLASGGLALALFMRARGDLEASAKAPVAAAAEERTEGTASSPKPAQGSAAAPAAASAAPSPVEAVASERPRKVGPPRSQGSPAATPTTTAQADDRFVKDKQGPGGGDLARSKDNPKTAIVLLPQSPKATPPNESLANCAAVQSYHCLPDVESSLHQCAHWQVQTRGLESASVATKRSKDTLCWGELNRLAQVTRR